MRLVSSYDNTNDMAELKRSYQTRALSNAKDLENTAQKLTEEFKNLNEHVKENINDSEELSLVEDRIRSLLGDYAKYLKDLKHFRNECELNGVSWRD